MQELEIPIICANTPQAKGRVEQANQTLQDRLTKEMGVQGISTPEQANSWLPTFIDDYNRRFAILPRRPVDVHRPLGDAEQLDQILRRKAERILSKNLIFQRHRSGYQIQVDRPTHAMRKAKVTVLENSKGEITVLYKNQPLAFVLCSQQADQARVVAAESIDFELLNASKAHKPAPDHPWRFPLYLLNPLPKLLPDRGHSNFGGWGDILTLG
ncbi:hypothetical protein [Thermanaerothrix daxensis]|uniref:hypothetical protein n=1 Tax=Thermanaerothrix daxensis TaxID=869279 RepID=UPI0006C93237|nr:hypothetical protein [Thermanaerothrix daxensis]